MAKKKINTKTKYGTSNAKMTNIGIKPKKTKKRKTGPIALPGSPDISRFNPNPKMKKPKKVGKTGPIALGDGPLFLPSDFTKVPKRSSQPGGSFNPFSTGASVVKSSMMGAKPPRLNIANSNFEGIAKSPKGFSKSVGKVGKKIGKGLKKNAFGLAAGAMGAIDALTSDGPIEKKIGGVVEAGLTAYNPLFGLGFSLGRPIFDDIITNVGGLFGGEGMAGRKKREARDRYKANFYENYAQENETAQNKQLEAIFKKYGYRG
jgi:hypothetical protein